MKFRSFLIVACIVLVPLIAMFSHRIPPGTRAAVAAFVRDLAGPKAAVPPAGDLAASPAPRPTSEVVAPSVPAGSGVEQAAATVAADAGPRVVPVAALAPEPEAFGPLRALGAVTLDCRPLGGTGGHVASCRLPVDGSGQLERVFQASGADATAAAENLLRDVAAWKRDAAGAGRTAAPTTMRF